MSRQSSVLVKTNKSRPSVLKQNSKHSRSFYSWNSHCLRKWRRQQLDGYETDFYLREFEQNYKRAPKSRRVALDQMFSDFVAGVHG